jgi:hypothetical protein
MAGKFEPKVAVNLDPPKDDIISKEELARANGTTSPLQDAQQSIEMFSQQFHLGLQL